MNRMNTGRPEWLILGTILVIALVLRMIRLDAGLWYDEIVTLVDFVRLPTAELMGTISSFNNHILFSLLAKASVAVFGETAWALRLPAVLFGVASIVALWWLARMIVTPAEAHFSALLLAVSYHHVWFSQNARGYTALMFWALLGTILFVKGIRQPSLSVWVAYASVVAAAGYTNLSIGFFFASHGLVYLVHLAVTIYRRRVATGSAAPFPTRKDLLPLLGFAIAGVLLGLLYLPALPGLLPSIEVAAAPSANVPPEKRDDPWKNPLWAVFEIARNLQDLGLLAGIGLPIVLVLSIVGAWNLIRKHPLVAWAFLANIPLTLFGLLVLSFRIRPRFFFIDQAFIFLCLVHGVYVVAEYIAARKSLRQWEFRGSILGGLASAAAVLCSLFLLPQNYRYPKQDFIGAKKMIESNRLASDAVVSVGLATVAYSKYYAPEWQVARSWEAVEEIRSKSSRTWLVHAFPSDTARRNPEVVERLESEFELVKVFPGTLGDGEILVYRSSEIPRSADQRLLEGADSGGTR
jgi:mannosyltransferase